MDVATAVSPKPRERIIATARELFRKHGIRGIGVDAIAEAAGTNKMTLYRHFGSKDDLVVVCLQGLAADADGLWDRLAAEHPGDAMAQLHAWLVYGGGCGGSDGRGCSMANAAVELAEGEHPAREVIAAFKRSQRDRLATLCRNAGIAAAETLADTLSLLLEGARSTRQSMGAEGPCANFVAVGTAVIASFASAAAPAASAARPGLRKVGRA
ncbi:MAG: TetR family transcriptional regulator [Tardiphaga sp.]|nr:TetR family transcriptional regulator [Tardiphaga sp.]